MNISFLGASGTVTGSNYLISTEKYKFILDCGQFQGGKKTEALNFIDFAYNPADIDFMILSHAHIDHSGRIPKLVKEGFKGRIYCTRGTSDLADILLKDSGHIHEKETEWENRKRTRAGLPKLEPLYTVADAEVAVKYLYPVLYDQTILINDEVTVRFKDAGHILGSAIVEVWVKENGHEKKLVFSGDLGMINKPLLRDPEFIDEADYLLIESTYGNRLHNHPEQRIDKLIKIILDTTDRGGTVVIPSFAVGRTQEIIYELNKYYDNKEEGKRFNRIPVYIDSPLATRATEIFRKNAEVFDKETRDFIMSGDNPLDFKNLHFTKTVEESIALNKNTDPKIIISASGMATAGRIKHHLKHHLWRSQSSVIFVGYQAEGTLGRRIKNGEKNVKVFGES
ncbi:MAG: MBL fold metallo-hydrolase, partial [Peptostreptococcaceae bacterium]|nr:MBL fold metallo-hydrolase [Peptostreptococcaceae bacterium]